VAKGTEHRQYALMAAALSMNQDPLAIMMASGRVALKMKKGCSEVLGQVDPAERREGRGLVVTEANIIRAGDGGDDVQPPVVAYSPAEVWQAWYNREAPFMLGKGAFNSLWRAPADCSLSSDQRYNNKEWSARVRTSTIIP